MRISKEVMDLIQRNIAITERLVIEAFIDNIKVTLELKSGFTDADYIKVMELLDNDLTEVKGTIWLKNEDMIILDFTPISMAMEQCTTVLEFGLGRFHCSTKEEFLKALAKELFE